MLPAIYTDASVRNVTAICPVTQQIGVAFDVPGQPPVRLALSRIDAVFLRSCLDDYISSPAGNHLLVSEPMPAPPPPAPAECALAANSEGV